LDVAVSGDRGCCLSQQLAADRYLFAVATGFGRIDGEGAAPLALRKLRYGLERRARSGRALKAAMARVNGELHARSASHEDYVTAGASMTAVLLIGERAYLAHVGSTAAYVVRDGSAVSLTRNDAFEGEPGLPVLMRALGLTRTLDLAISTFVLRAGDALVLAERPLPVSAERLVITFQGVEASQVPAPAGAHTAPSILTGVLATVLFYAMLCVR